MTNSKLLWAVVVALLVEMSLPIPEFCSSNPAIGNFMMNLCTVNCLKDENKEKEVGNDPFYLMSQGPLPLAPIYDTLAVTNRKLLKQNLRLAP